MNDRYHSLIVSALEFAIQTLREIKSDPGLFVEFCNIKKAVPQLAMDKLVAETALFALLAHRVLGSRTLVNSLAVEIAPLVGTESHYSLLRANPAAAAGLALAQTCLKLIGVEKPEFERLLHQCLSESSLIEKPVFREMEQIWLQSLYANSGRPDCSKLIGRSVSARVHDSDWDDTTAYAFTHEVFYLTDFGIYQFQKDLITENLVEAMDNSIAINVGRNNLDILSELCMARCIIGAPPSRAAELGDALIVNSWEYYGFLPGPNFTLSEQQRLNKRMRRLYFNFCVYHTTYVGALYLITKWLLGGVSPEDTWKGCADSSNIAWGPRLRDGDAPILMQILARAPGDIEPVLVKAAEARARNGLADRSDDPGNGQLS